MFGPFLIVRMPIVIGGTWALSIPMYLEEAEPKLFQRKYACFFSFTKSFLQVNQTEDEILADFESRFPPSSEIDPDQLRAFVEQHFEPEGHELEK